MTGEERRAARQLVDEKQRARCGKEAVPHDALWERVNEATCDVSAWPESERAKHVNNIVRTVIRCRRQAA